jgi:hypothetical protein
MSARYGGGMKQTPVFSGATGFLAGALNFFVFLRVLRGFMI